MASVTVRLDDRKIDGLFDNSKELRTYMERHVAETVAVARVEVPVRSSELQRSIGSSYHGGGQWRVTASAPHAKWVHNGTEPHEIRAKRGRTLRFFWKKVGLIVYPIAVNHPGTEPNPFLTRAMHKVWD